MCVSQQSNEVLAPLRVGVVGYSGQEFDKVQAREFLRQIFDQIRKTEGVDVDIVSGLTAVGIPLLAYELAEEYGFKTTGITCQQALDEGWELWPCDRKFIKGKYWGSKIESDFFLGSIDCLIRVGGGNQAHRECQQFRTTGKPVYELELKSLSAA